MSQEINTYASGTRIELSAIFRNKAGENFDPAVVRFKVRPPGTDPEEATVLSSPGNPATGEYFVEISVEEEGRWRWRAEGENPALTAWAADERVFEVERSGFD